MPGRLSVRIRESISGFRRKTSSNSKEELSGKAFRIRLLSPAFFTNLYRGNSWRNLPDDRFNSAKRDKYEREHFEA
jgi:hypothetical protein